MEKITPFLWFDNQAEEAAKYYCSIFKRSKIRSVSRFDNAGPDGKQKVTTVSFELEGQAFVGLNGGPHYHFTPAVSFYVDCKDQKEVDVLWEKLSKGGQTQPCGWLTDRYGVSWQIIPSGLMDLIKDPNGMAAMLKMSKLDIEAVKAAVRAGKSGAPEKRKGLPKRAAAAKAAPIELAPKKATSKKPRK